MKKLTILLLIFSTSLSSLLNSQTLYSDEHGVRLNVEIKDIGKSVNCENNWDRNYTDKSIKVWEVSLIFRNGSTKKIKPKLVGISTIDVIPSDGKVFDYCGYRNLNRHGVDNMGQQLVAYTIFNPRMPIIEAGRRVSSSAYLYLYSDVKPILKSWNFLGYEFLDGSSNPEHKANGSSNEAREIMFKSINKESTEKNKPTQKEKEYSETDDYINSEIKNNIRGITNMEIDSSFVDLNAIENAVEQNPDYYDELTSCMESGNAKYYRDKLKNVSTSNLKAMQAYSQLSIFYSYQCECEIGSTRPEQLVKDMNQLVATFNNATRNSTFAPLKKVYQCKKIESNTELDNTSTSVSQSNSDAIKKVVTEMKLRDDEAEAVNIISKSKNSNEALARLKERNIQKLNSYTLDALNKLTNEIQNFPLTGSEIQTLINGGSFKDILKNYNLRASNKLAQNLGLDYNQTQALNIIATSENKEEMIERLKQNNIQQISQKTANGLQKMLGDSYGSLPITSGDITNLINGNFEEAITTMKYNQDINSISKLTGGDTELASDIYNLASIIGDELNKPKTPEQLKALFAKKFDKERNVSYWANDTLISMNTAFGKRGVNYNYKGRRLVKSQTYDLDGNIITETIHTENEFVTSNYTNNTKFKTTHDGKGNVLKTVDLISGKTIFDSNDKLKETTEEIQNEKGKKIGERIFKNGKLFQEIYDTKKEKKVISFENDIKQAELYYSKKGIFKTIPFKEISYEKNGDILLIRTTEFVKSKTHLVKQTQYKNGTPFSEQIFENGVVISDREL